MTDNVAESIVMGECIGCGVSYGFFWKAWCSSISATLHRDNARVGVLGVCSAGWCAAGDHSKLSGWHLRRGRSFLPLSLGARHCCCSVACREAIACPPLGVWAHTHALAETRGRKQRFTSFGSRVDWAGGLECPPQHSSGPNIDQSAHCKCPARHSIILGLYMSGTVEVEDSTEVEVADGRWEVGSW